MLKRWLALPLKDEDAINKRLNIVEYFHSNSTYTTNVYNLVSQIGDLERLISKLSTGRILPREFQQIANSIEVVEEIKQVLQTSDNKDLKNLSKKLWDCDDLKSLIDKTIKENPSVLISKGDVIAFGVSDELDELRDLRSNGKNKLAEIQKREEELTGITSLKISFNNVFGYFLEVRNTHKDKVPESWIRKQTLVNAERYITEELKEYESKILGAEEKIQVIESKLYQELIEKSFAFISVLKQNAEGVAYLDCLSSLANFALKNNYKKPNVNTGREIKITGGRHPVIEQHLPPDNPYIDNDLLLNSETQQIIMITGPNMSGKSALLRQTALIVLLAQIGSFVPAKSAEIGIVDKIFVRVGASDNISQGESTFMVEMNETASILNNLSENSLVLLDEIGRGTSTYDGISIAWAIAEFLHQHPNKPNTLFATHYHELNEMTGLFPRIKNFNVSVKEIKNKIIFLRKLKEGGSEHSFGIHVAKMAGMPAFVLNKAGNILKKLEESRSDETNKEQITSGSESQLSFFQLDDPLLDEIKDTLNQLEINTLTPVEALMILNEMKGKLSG
jgi:DNA mismatch repair protein MutS